MAIDLTSIDVPRHVHKPGGVSQIVWSHAELETAVAEGWLIDPNQPQSALVVEAEPAVVTEDAHDAPNDIDDVPVSEPEAPAADVPTPKKRGRPRKGA